METHNQGLHPAGASVALACAVACLAALVACMWNSHAERRREAQNDAVGQPRSHAGTQSSNQSHPHSTQNQFHALPAGQSCKPYPCLKLNLSQSKAFHQTLLSRSLSHPRPVYPCPLSFASIRCSSTVCSPSLFTFFTSSHHTFNFSFSLRLAFQSTCPDSPISLLSFAHHFGFS